MNPLPHRGAFASFPKKERKKEREMPGGWALLELTEPLCKNFLLLKLICPAIGHVSENALYIDRLALDNF